MMAFKNYNKSINTRIFNNIKLDIHQLMSDINQANTPFYTDEIFLKKKILPLYKEKYSWNPRIYNIKVPDYCGPYVGSVIDEYDNHYNKLTHEFYDIEKKCWIKNNKSLYIVDNEFNISKYLLDKIY
jgi:hypothetical protein|tara:strand:- start:2061 stop:2441 length:381 start_codon:yes stop_codon:yes gene_type:complete